VATHGRTELFGRDGLLSTLSPGGGAMASVASIQCCSDDACDIIHAAPVVASRSLLLTEAKLT